MDTRLFARIGAGAFVAIALTMTALQLRDEPKAARSEPVAVWQPDGDPFAAQLRACAAMGEGALAWSGCRAAWAEKRRRFLGTAKGAGDHGVDPAVLDPAPDVFPSGEGR